MTASQRLPYPHHEGEERHEKCPGAESNHRHEDFQSSVRCDYARRSAVLRCPDASDGVLELRRRSLVTIRPLCVKHAQHVTETSSASTSCTWQPYPADRTPCTHGFTPHAGGATHCLKCALETKQPRDPSHSFLSTGVCSACAPVHGCTDQGQAHGCHVGRWKDPWLKPLVEAVEPQS